MAQFQGRTVDVLLTPMSQQSPSTSAVPGQMKKIVNGQINKFDGNGSTRFKIEKRNGFRQATKEVHDVVTGAQITAAGGFPEPPDLFASLALEQVISSDGHAYVLAEGGNFWSKFPYKYNPTTVKQHPVYVANTQIANPTGAAVDNVFMRTWSEPYEVNHVTRGAMAMVTDADGTPIRAPFNLASGTNDVRAKVVADGTRFWVVFSAGTALVARMYDIHGVQIGSEVTVATTSHKALPWDLTFQQGCVLLAYTKPASANTVTIARLSESAGAIAVSINEVGFNMLGEVGIAWAENDTTDGNVYLLTSHYDGDGGQKERAFQIDNVATTPVVTHYYGVGNDNTSFIYSGSGEDGGDGILYNMTGVNTDAGFFVQLGYLEDSSTTNYHALSRTLMFNLTLASATPTISKILRSVVQASHTFKLGNQNVYVAYYPSGLPSYSLIPPGATKPVGFISQPTYFLIDVTNGQMCGQFDTGIAGMEWARKNYPEDISGFDCGPFFFCVGDVFTDVDGKIHVSLGFQSRAVNETSIANDIVGNIVRLTATVGFQDLVFGGLGQAVEHASELLMPGPLATSFGGYSLGENGISLAPEQPTVAVSTYGGSGLTLDGIYNHVLVFERTMPNGDVVKSAVSVPSPTVTLAGAQNEITITTVTLHMTTYTDVIISVYRNIMSPGGGTTGIHYKVTDDLNPLYNDDGSITVSFVDHVPDATISVNEILYTDLDFVNRVPCPPFNCGCVFEDRIVVAGIDGAIWISGQKEEGVAIWFSDNPAFRLPMANSDEIKQLVALDMRIGILCEKSMWAVPGGGFPGPDGLGGNLSAPQMLPFTNGATGFSAIFPGGALYSSNAGNAWVLSRGLENIPIGLDASEDFLDRDIVGISLDNKQRIAFAMRGDFSHSAAFEVYDQLAKAWSQYVLPTGVYLSHAIRGALAYADDSSVWIQEASLWSDVALATEDDAPPVLSSYETELIALSSIKNFQRVWNSIVTGSNDGLNYGVRVTVTQDCNGNIITSQHDIDPPTSNESSFTRSIPLIVEECSRIGFKFEDTFADPLFAGRTFGIEALSLYVATASGLVYVPTNQIVAARRLPVTGAVTGSSDRVTVLRLNGAQDINVIPGATTFTFPIGLPAGMAFTVVKLSGPGTVLNATGITADPQATTPTLSL